MDISTGFRISLGALLVLTGCASNSQPKSVATPQLQPSSSTLAPPAAEPVSALGYKAERKRKALEGLIYEAGAVRTDGDAARVLVPFPEEAKAPALRQQGIEQLNRNENLAAIGSFTHAILNDPSDSDSYLLLGRALLTQKGWDDRAEAAYATGLVLAPDSAELHFAHGDSLWRLVRLAEALKEFEAAVELDSTLARAWVRLANGRYLTRDYVGAWEAVQATEALGASVPSQMRSKLIEKL